MREPPIVHTHLVDIYPPTNVRPTWLATCSLHDFSQSFMNRVEAFVAASKHGTDAMLRAELDTGIYSFDDGSM